MKFNVLTPFSRSYNLIELGNRIKEEGAHWHLLCVEGEHEYPNLGTWVTQHFFPAPPAGFFIGHWLVNQFLKKGIADEDRYVVITDDDFIEPGCFQKLDQYDDDILIVSMKRGEPPTEGDGGGPFDTLIAKPENIRVASVGFEQLVIKGKVFKEYRCGPEYHADGLLIMKLFEERMEQFRFVPDAFVYFNYLPPGRWGRWGR